MKVLNLIIILNCLLISSKTLSACNTNDINSLEKNIAENIQKEPSVNPIKIEGLLPNNSILLKSYKTRQDLTILHNAAWGYINGINEEKTLKQSQEFILEWTRKYKPSYNPIDEASFVLYLDAYGMIRNTFNDDYKQEIDNFIKNWAINYAEQIQLHKDSNGSWSNNWNSYRIRFIVFSAFVTNDKNLIALSRKLYFQQISKNIDSDGITIDFKERDALHYVVFDLIPLVDSAILAKLNNEDWYTKESVSGSSLKKAIEWLIPYITGNKSHEEFKNTTVEFDKLRARYGMNDYSGNFKSEKAGPLLWNASKLDQKYTNLAQKVLPNYNYNLSLCWK